MKPSQIALRKAKERLKAIEVRAAEITATEEMTEDLDKEIRELAAEKKAMLQRVENLESILDAEERESVVGDAAPADQEERERRELRGKALLGRYLVSAVTGQRVDGAEAEFRAACGIADGIPLDLIQWPERGGTERRADAATPAPANTAQNLAMIAPAVFAASILPQLGVEMPTVPSGTYGQPRITASLTAGTQAKGDDAMSTKATIGLMNTTPHRISGRLSLQVEDLLGSGLEDMETALRQNLTLVMSDALDAQGLTGDGQGNNLTGLHTAVTAATAASKVVDYESAVESVSGLVDGVWARSKMDLGLTVNTRAYAKFSALWRGQNADVSLADHFAAMLGAFGVHARMPANDSQNRADALVVRRGQAGIRLAVMPVWNRALAIDDIFPDSASGTKHLTIHSIVGDVLVAQPDAYRRLSFKTA